MQYTRTDESFNLTSGDTECPYARADSNNLWIA